MTSPGRLDAPRGAALWPELWIADWAETYATLHMITQIVGKMRLALAPMQNHWWQVTLYVGARGLTTSAMPYRGRTISIELDFVDHVVVIRTSEGGTRTVPLVARPVAQFYEEYLTVLRSLDLQIPIFARPVEVEVSVPFAKDTVHASYDREAVDRWWGAMLQTDRVFRSFRGDFEGKASPVQFFWGSFDLAATRFSGRAAPLHPGGAPNCPDYVMQEAYSRECSSCGFWPGGGTQEAAYYAYAYPEPPGFSAYKVSPEAAYYDSSLREFILPYDAVRTADSPDAMLRDFLQSTYVAEAELAKWDRGMLERTPRQTESS